MARRYRMTPKRKSALKKAQAASAKKRRGTRNRRLSVAGGVTVVAVTAGAAYFGRHHLARAARATRGVPKAPPPGKELVHIPGMGRGGSGTAFERDRMSGPNRIVPFGNPGHEVSMMIHGRRIGARNRRNAEKRARQRNKKVFRQRMTYRKENNPIPRVNRFTRAQARRRKKK